MSLNMSNAASLVSDSNIPQLPDRREDFLGYEWKMKAYLDVRGLLGFIEPPAVKDTAKDGQDANGKDIASSSSSPIVIPKEVPKESSKARCYGILINSIPDKRMNMVTSSTKLGEAEELWKLIKRSFGTDNSVDNKLSLSRQLMNLMKKESESMHDYLFRVDQRIADYENIGGSIDNSTRTNYILNGLRHLSKWEREIEYIINSNAEIEWPKGKLNTQLINKENSKKIQEEVEKSKQVESANTITENRNRGRGRSGGRANNFRGKFNNTRGRRNFNNSRNDEKNENNSGTIEEGGNTSANNIADGNNSYRGRSNFRGRNNFKNNNYRKDHRGIKCYNCGKEGHIQKNCWSNNIGKSNNIGNENFSSGSSSGNSQSFVTDIKNSDVACAFTAYAPHVSSFMSNNENKNSEWLLDSGASSHFTGDRSLLENIVKLNEPLVAKTGNGISNYSEIGDINLQINDKMMILKEVIYIPKFSANLISAGRIVNKAMHNIVLDYNGVKIINKHNNEVFVSGVREGNMFKINETCSVSYLTKDERVANEKIKLRDLHKKFGHLSYSSIYKLLKSGGITGLKINMDDINYTNMLELGKEECIGCLKGKFIKAPTTSAFNYGTTSIMDLMVADVVGPIKDPTYDDKRYILQLVDVHSRYLFSAIMEHKNDSTAIIIKTIKNLQVQTGLKLKRFHSDGGGEFVNKELELFFSQNGTTQSTTVPYTPEHNSIVERMNRTELEMMKAMMHHCGAPVWLWGEASNYSGYLLNRRITNINDKKTPSEIFNKKKPNLGGIHVFGCDVYYYNHKVHRDSKLDVTSINGAFVGIEKNNDGYYRVFDSSKNRIIITKDIKFFDNHFTAVKKLHVVTLKDDEIHREINNLAPSDDYFSDDQIEQLGEQFVEDNSNQVNNNNDNNNLNDEVSGAEEEININGGSVSPININTDSISAEHDNNNDNSPVVVSNDSVKDLSSSTRVEKVENSAVVVKNPEVLNLRAATKVNKVNNNSSSNIRASTREKKPWLRYINEAHIAQEEPVTYTQAVNSQDSADWKKAINEELQSLEKNNTWSYVNRSRNMNIIGCKWVFKKKKDMNGKVQRYKARLVAKGYNQEYGIDYGETFAPVLKYKSLRIILSMAAIYGLELQQLDIKTAFLNAEVTENIYVELPEGINIKDKSENTVLKLNRALYGIKQAPKLWNDNLNNKLISIGFKPCIKDTCIYVKESKNKNNILLGIFVDDILAAYNKVDEKEWIIIKNVLSAVYDLSDLGQLHHILGMRVKRNNNSIYLDQSVYIRDKLKLYNMQESKSQSTPEELNKLIKCEENELLDEKLVTVYRGIVGSLIYASISTRPDVTHAVNMLSRFMSRPGKTHLNAGKRILRYLQGSSEYGLQYNRNKNEDGKITISAYSDSDWGGDSEDRKSTTGYVVFINNNLVSWSTKKQATVALSTAEAELMAAAEVIKEVIWMKYILNELMYEVRLPIHIFIDNQSTIKIIQNDIEHDRTKHIDIKYHFMKEKIKEGIIFPQWIETEKQLGDLFTKSLSLNVFRKFRDELMVLQ